MRVVCTLLLFALVLLIDSIESAKGKPPPRPSRSPTPSPPRSPSPPPPPPSQTASSSQSASASDLPIGVRFIPMSMKSTDIVARGRSYLCKYFDDFGIYLVIDGVTGHSRWGPGEPKEFDPNNFRPGDLLLRKFSDFPYEIYGVFEENGRWDGFRLLPVNQRIRWSTYLEQM